MEVGEDGFGAVFRIWPLTGCSCGALTLLRVDLVRLMEVGCDDVDGSGEVFRCGLEYGALGLEEWVKSGYTRPEVNSQSSSPKLSRKPKRFMVSSGEKRSAEEGRGGGLGKMLGSKEKSKSGKGAGGRNGVLSMLVTRRG